VKLGVCAKAHDFIFSRETLTELAAYQPLENVAGAVVVLETS
jgi:hypothetical protein